MVWSSQSVTAASSDSMQASTIFASSLSVWVRASASASG